MMFLAGGLGTLFTSLVLFGFLVISKPDGPNTVALVTLIGAPFAYWLAWVMPASRLARAVSVGMFAASAGPAMFGWVIFVYLPWFVCLLAGTPVPHADTGLTEG